MVVGEVTVSLNTYLPMSEFTASAPLFVFEKLLILLQPSPHENKLLLLNFQDC